MKTNKNNNIMKTRILFNLCLLLSLGSTIGQAQPAWSVTPEDFQYSMTVTASVTINGNEVQNTTSIVGAFYKHQNTFICSDSVHTDNSIGALTINPWQSNSVTVPNGFVVGD